MKAFTYKGYTFTYGFILAWIPAFVWYGFTIWLLTIQNHKPDVIILSLTLGMATVAIIWKVKSLINEKNQYEKQQSELK